MNSCLKMHKSHKKQFACNGPKRRSLPRERRTPVRQSFCVNPVCIHNCRTGVQRSRENRNDAVVCGLSEVIPCPGLHSAFHIPHFAFRIPYSSVFICIHPWFALSRIWKCPRAIYHRYRYHERNRIFLLPPVIPFLLCVPTKRLTSIKKSVTLFEVNSM